MPLDRCLFSSLYHKDRMSSNRNDPLTMYPRTAEGGNLSHGADIGITDTNKGPLNHLTQWVASLRDFSPFAFASPVLEQQYQDYQSMFAASHVGTMCWLLGIMWVAWMTFMGNPSTAHPSAWLFTTPLALCIGFGVFSSFAPVTFRRNWQACSFAITVAHVLMYDTMHSSNLAFRTASGKLHDGTLLEMEFNRLFGSFFFAMGAPLSLPPWAIAQALLFATQNFSLAGKCASGQGSECITIPWPVSSAMHSIVIAYLGPGAHVPVSSWCRVCLVFWKVQMEMMGAVFGVLRDIAWRRAFLISHPHLIGHNGAARAAAWPFGSLRMVVTCLGLVLWLLCIDVMAVDFWVAAIVRGA